MTLRRAILRVGVVCCAVMALSVPGNAQELPLGLQSAVAPEDAAQPETIPKTLSEDSRLQRLFGDVDQLEELPTFRRALARSPAANAVFSEEATGRRTSDVGQLLQASKSAQGVAIQYRTPIASDTRVRGQRVGQILASGSYWAPARMDMDTMMSKIDSRLIEDLILIKGPYATRYGPGFRFVDLEFVPSPRFETPQAHGSTSATYNSNGQHWYGRQTALGGGDDYGFLVSYGHQTANDYETGLRGFFMPASFKSRDIFVAAGLDGMNHESLEFNVLRLDQTDVEIPGMVFDLNHLVTDGYEATYTNWMPSLADISTIEVWYNRTRYEGDTSRPSKKKQIPSLGGDLSSPSGEDGEATTDGDALSGGYRWESRYDNGAGHVLLGSDLIVLSQEINDIEPLGPMGFNNFPLPRSSSVDVGFYAEKVAALSDRVLVTTGARIDGVFTDAADWVPGLSIPISQIKQTNLDQHFLLGAAYLTGEYRLSKPWTLSLGAGTAHRPPTLTELYAERTFIGTLQRGLTFLLGDPELKPEKAYQLDASLRYRNDATRFGFHAHCAWIHDFIAYDLINPPMARGFEVGAAFVNTDLATIAGFETYAQHRIDRATKIFGNVSFTEGRDLARTKPARQSPLPVRSGVPGVEHEPLPGIYPLETRLGLQIHEPIPNPRWSVELLARVVDNQDRVAKTLQEKPTPGFTVYDVRSYFTVGRMLMTMGLENMTDKFYQEHIDFRAGRGVFRRGRSFYVGTELRY